MIVKCTLPGVDGYRYTGDYNQKDMVFELRQEHTQRSTQSQLAKLRMVHSRFANLKFIIETLFHTVYLRTQSSSNVRNKKDQEKTFPYLQSMAEGDDPADVVVASLVRRVILRPTYLYPLVYNEEPETVPRLTQAKTQGLKELVNPFNARHAEVVREGQVCEALGELVHPDCELVVVAPRNNLTDSCLRTVNGWTLEELLNEKLRPDSLHSNVLEYVYDEEFLNHSKGVSSLDVAVGVLRNKGLPQPDLRQLCIDFRGWEGIEPNFEQYELWDNMNLAKLTKLCLRYESISDGENENPTQQNVWLEKCCRDLQELEVDCGDVECIWPNGSDGPPPPAMPQLRRLTVRWHEINIPDCVRWLQKCPKLEYLHFANHTVLGPIGGVDRLQPLFETLRNLPSLLEVRLDGVDAGLGSPDERGFPGMERKLLSFDIYTRQALSDGRSKSATNDTDLGQAIQNYLSCEGEWEPIQEILERDKTYWRKRISPDWQSDSEPGYGWSSESDTDAD